MTSDSAAHAPGEPAITTAIAVTADATARTECAGRTLRPAVMADVTSLFGQAMDPPARNGHPSGRVAHQPESDNSRQLVNKSRQMSGRRRLLLADAHFGVECPDIGANLVTSEVPVGDAALNVSIP